MLLHMAAFLTFFLPIKSILIKLFSINICSFFKVVNPYELLSISYFLLPILKPQSNIRVIIIAQILFILLRRLISFFISLFNLEKYFIECLNFLKS